MVVSLSYATPCETAGHDNENHQQSTESLIDTGSVTLQMRREMALSWRAPFKLNIHLGTPNPFSLFPMISRSFSKYRPASRKHAGEKEKKKKEKTL